MDTGTRTPALKPGSDIDLLFDIGSDASLLCMSISVAEEGGGVTTAISLGSRERDENSV